MIKWHEHPDRDAVSAHAADCLANGLRRQLETRDRATLVVSGGSTPHDCFARLAGIDLPWSRVDITLTDERCVPSDHADSNERMVRERLMVGAAAQATFVPLDRATDATFAAVLVGMGADGHFASLFPDADSLADGLNLGQTQLSLPVSTAASPHMRVTMPLARLLRTDRLLLLIFGDDKRRIVESPGDTPVAALLAQPHRRVEVLWAP